MPKTKGLTKKQIRGYTKSSLINILKENNISVKKSMSKTSLVDMVFKNKELRMKLDPPQKRKPSQKQLEARKKFAERMKNKKDEPKTNPKKMVSKQEAEKISKKTGLEKNEIESAYINKPVGKPVVKSKIEINPTSSNQTQVVPKQNKEPKPLKPEKSPKMVVKTDKPIKQPKMIIGKSKNINTDNTEELTKKPLVITQYKNEKKFKSKAQLFADRFKRQGFTSKKIEDRSDTHEQRIKKNMKLKKKLSYILNKNDDVQNSKTSDTFDRYVLGLKSKERRRQLNKIKEGIHQHINKNKQEVDEFLLESIIANEDKGNQISELEDMLEKRKKDLELKNKELEKKDIETEKKITIEKELLLNFNDRVNSLNVIELRKVLRKTGLSPKQYINKRKQELVRIVLQIREQSEIYVDEIITEKRKTERRKKEEEEDKEEDIRDNIIDEFIKKSVFE